MGSATPSFGRCSARLGERMGSTVARVGGSDSCFGIATARAQKPKTSAGTRTP